MWTIDVVPSKLQSQNILFHIPYHYTFPQIDIVLTSEFNPLTIIQAIAPALVVVFK